MTAPNNKPIPQELKDDFINYYQFHGNWGNLSNVLTKENVSTESIDQCIKRCEMMMDGVGFKLAGSMKSMSKSQLIKLGRSMRN